MKKFVLALLTLTAFVFLGCATAPPPTREQLANADYGDPPSNHEELIKSFLSASLIDPYSAMYTFDHPVKGWTKAAGEAYGWVVCGSLNAKNRFGGYVGAKPFYVMIKNNKIIRCLHEGKTEPDSFSLGFIAANPQAILGICKEVYGR